MSYGNGAARWRHRRRQARAHERVMGDAANIEADMEQEARRFRELAPVFGFCGACGCTVDEANGVLHASDCPYLPPERRRPA